MTDAACAMEIEPRKDHVHFLVQSVPTHNATKLVAIIKSSTIGKIFRHCPEAGKQLLGGEFWTDGYFTSTVGRQDNEETAGAYVKAQGEAYSPLRQDRQLQLF